MHGAAGADPCEPPDIASYPHDAVEFSAPAQRVYAAGSALGLRPFKIPLAINFSDAARSLCLRCITCDGFPCKVEAKNDMATTVLAAAQADGLDIVVGAVARRLAQRGGRVEGIEYVDAASGEEHALAALTTVPADLLDAESDLGTVEKGRLANLTIVQGDSWFDPENPVTEVLV